MDEKIIEKPFDEVLISYVEKMSHLYDKRNKHYKDEKVKQNTWIWIGNKLDCTPEYARKRWDTLRCNFVKALRKYKTKPPSGSKAPNQSETEITFIYFKSMLWLAPYIRKEKVITSYKSPLTKENVRTKSLVLSQHNLNVQSTVHRENVSSCSVKSQKRALANYQLDRGVENTLPSQSKRPLLSPSPQSPLVLCQLYSQAERELFQPEDEMNEMEFVDGPNTPAEDDEIASDDVSLVGPDLDDEAEYTENAGPEEEADLSGPGTETTFETQLNHVQGINPKTTSKKRLESEMCSAVQNFSQLLSKNIKGDGLGDGDSSFMKSVLGDMKHIVSPSKKIKFKIEVLQVLSKYIGE